MAAANHLRTSGRLSCESAEGGPFLASVHGQLLFLWPRSWGMSGGPVRRSGELSSWASGLAGQCLPHPAQGPRACQIWPAAWFCMACGLRLALHWFSWRRISCVTHGEWPVGRLCLGFIHSTNIYRVLPTCGALAGLCLWGSPVEMCVGAGVLASPRVAGSRLLGRPA